jgi:hypothetical protein
MVRLLLFLAMLLAYPAMAGASAPATEAVQAPQSTEAIQARRAVLEQRVTAWWDALIRQDFALAYSFTSPGYRKAYSVDAFKVRFDTKSNWRRAEVRNVDFKSDDNAIVGINMHFVYHQPKTGEALDMQNYIQEPWVFMDGQWWYLVKD